MSTTIFNKGVLILILGPSGSGKGTVLSYLKSNHPEFVFPVSCTTRDKRPHEVNGEVYYFLSKDEFKKRIEDGDFLEYAVVHGDNYYGTLKQQILDPLSEGKTVIREVDVQGVRSIKSMSNDFKVVTIFLTSPWEDLKRRIVNRAPISDDELARRHESYLKEIEWKKECDYFVESKEGEIKQVCEKVESLIVNSVS